MSRWLGTSNKKASYAKPLTMFTEQVLKRLEIGLNVCGTNAPRHNMHSPARGVVGLLITQVEF